MRKFRLLANISNYEDYTKLSGGKQENYETVYGWTGREWWAEPTLPKEKLKSNNNMFENY